MVSCIDVVAVLKVCAKQKDIHTGHIFHANALREGLLDTNVFIGSTLVNMYAKCGELPKAQHVFDELPFHDIISWNALMSGYVVHGHGEKALTCFELLKCRGLLLDAMTYASILKACACTGAAEMGKEIHCDIMKKGWLYKDSVLGTALVDMYAKCGALAKAQQAFDQLSTRDIVSWNALIAGYAHQDCADLAFDCLNRMACDGLLPNAVTLACILKACGSVGALDKGVKVHDLIHKTGMHKIDGVLGTALVDMYAKCGELARAQQVFDELSVRDEVCWSALCTGYCQHGQGERVFNHFKQMKSEGIPPGESTLSCSLKACASLGVADKGQEIHAEIIKEGFEKSDLLGNVLVDMYVKCGVLAKAQVAMNEHPVHTAVSWNALIAGYAQNGHSEQALICFEQMQMEGVAPDPVTFLSLLKACGGAEMGSKIHAEIVRLGHLKDNNVLGSALVDMYAKYGALEKAQEVFKEFPLHDVVSWTAVVAGYAQLQHGEEALSFFEQMEFEGFSPNAVTFSCVLKACGCLGATEKGERIHARIWDQRFVNANVGLCNAFVDMYVKCGKLSKAQEVFDKLSSHDVILWNTLLAGYIQSGKHEIALNMFQKMRDEGTEPSGLTYTAVLEACKYLHLVDEAQMHFETMTTWYEIIPTVEHHTCLVEIFGDAGQFASLMSVIEKVAISDRLPMWFALLNACRKWRNVKLGKLAFEHAVQLDENSVAAYVCMSNVYAAVGMQEDASKTFVKAQQLFDKLVYKDLGSWNALISGFYEHGRGEEALECFKHIMRSEGLCPDIDTFLLVLKACGSIGAVEKGMEVHEEIVRVGLGAFSLLGNALVDMYAKCGALGRARLVFDELPTRDVVCWTALIAGYCEHGHSEDALNIFEQMIGEGLSPDMVTFTCILKVCSNVGAVEKGLRYFYAMTAKHGITPSVEHYTCMVGLLGNAGNFGRAIALLKKMPSDCSKAWFTLLSASRKGGNVKSGSLAFDHAMQTNDKSALAYAFMSNLCAAAGMQEDAGSIKALS